MRNHICYQFFVDKIVGPARLGPTVARIPPPYSGTINTASDSMSASKSSVSATVYAIRRDGFSGPIKLNFKGLPTGLTSSAVTLKAKKDVARLRLKTSLMDMEKPVNITVEGSAKIGNRQLVHTAVPAEDRMQAFLWRHLLPAEDLPVLVYNRSYRPPVDRVRPPILDKDRPKGVKRTLKKSSVDWYLRQIEALYQDWFFTDKFANRQVASIEARLIK